MRACCGLLSVVQLQVLRSSNSVRRLFFLNPLALSLRLDGFEYLDISDLANSRLIEKMPTLVADGFRLDEHCVSCRVRLLFRQFSRCSLLNLSIRRADNLRLSTGQSGSKHPLFECSLGTLNESFEHLCSSRLGIKPLRSTRGVTQNLSVHVENGSSYR